MRIALFLPHVGVFGGVRRFLELGNAWSNLGHAVTLYHPDGKPPEWLAFAGSVAPLDGARASSSDLALCADPHTLDAFAAHSAAARIYYCVIEGDPGVRRAMRIPGLRLAANSGALLRRLPRVDGRAPIDGIGGIQLRQFHPGGRPRPAAPLRVLLNGRRSRPRKGTDLILRALAGIAPPPGGFEIVLFDSIGEHNRQDPRDGAPLPPGARFVMGPSQEELVALFQSAHVFVAAERKAGWCNTALEALACGCAVVCTRSGTMDFARHGENALVSWRNPWSLKRAVRRLFADPALRERLGAAGPASAAPWSWERLAVKLLDQLQSAATDQRSGR
jgi:glycosyltransferase involved in cell wall biosynthesis